MSLYFYIYGKKLHHGLGWGERGTFIFVVYMLITQILNQSLCFFPTMVYCCHLWYMVSLMPVTSGNLVCEWLSSLWHLVFRFLSSVNLSICFLSYKDGLGLLTCCSLCSSAVHCSLFASIPWLDFNGSILMEFVKGAEMSHLLCLTECH